MTESPERDATPGKAERQHHIARLLSEQSVSSQAQLVELLASERIETTQATVSRDLEELGAVKARVPGGGTAYVIPEDTDERLTFTRGDLVSAVIDGLRAAFDIALPVACDLEASQGDVDAAISEAYDQGVVVTAGRLLLGPDEIENVRQPREPE